VAELCAVPSAVSITMLYGHKFEVNEAMYMKICVVGDVLDVITYAKFQNEIFRGYNFTGGRSFHFPIDFEWALQQCSATALPVMWEEKIDVHYRVEIITLSVV